MIGIKVQSFFGFVLPFLILVSIFEMLVLNAKEMYIELF